jgi:putative RNA 2'-phosphotransferase
MNYPKENQYHITFFMSKVDDTRISKFLSLVLRHKPEEIGLKLNDEGWAHIEDLIDNSKQKGFDLTIELLKRVVENNDKKRFSFSEDFSKIRANQGHSIDVNLQLKPTQPPVVLYHGTIKKNITSIFEKGLLKQNRNYIHLTNNYDLACTIGKRYGSPVVLEVAALQMHSKGYDFFISKNEVWLTDHIPPEFIQPIN